MNPNTRTDESIKQLQIRDEKSEVEPWDVKDDEKLAAADLNQLRVSKRQLTENDSQNTDAVNAH